MNVLPDSRLKVRKGTVMVDWPNPDGTVVRMEVEPCFCIQCGRQTVFVPVGPMSWVSFMCDRCAADCKEFADRWMSSDEVFWRDVAYEMVARFGCVLTHEQIVHLSEQGRLGTALEKLARESPYQLPRV